MKRLLRFLSPLRISGMVTLGLIIVVVAVACFVFFSRTRQDVARIRLSTGRTIEPEKSITKFFKSKRAADHGLAVEIVATQGSEDSLARVQNGEIDLAVVKGGMRLGGRDNVRQVTALDFESFHLLVRNDDLADKVRKDMGALRGHSININKPLTGTYHWCLDILAFAGLRPAEKGKGEKGNFTPAHLGNPELIAGIRRVRDAPAAQRAGAIAELPDAVLFADQVPSPIVRDLVNVAGYRLVPLEFGPAYVQQLHAAPPRDQDLDEANVLIEAVSIPAYSYSVSPAVPPQSCATIGVRRLLITNKNVPVEAVVRCLRLLHDGQPEPALDFLEWSKVRFEYPPHDAVRRYDDERRQVLQTTIMKLFERLASVLGGIVGCILAIYGYYRYRRLLRFEHYFHEIRRIELIARGKEEDPNAPTERAARLAYLLNKLADLRTAAITEFAQGRLQGESLILSIFTLLQDTSTNLSALLADRKEPVSPLA